MAGKKETTYEHRRALQKTHQDSAQPPEFGGLTEVDLGTSLPSRVPESMCPPSSATLLRLLGGKALGWTVEGSLMDQDEGST